MLKIRAHAWNFSGILSQQYRICYRLINVLQSVEIDRCAGHILQLDSSKIPPKYCNCQILPAAFQWGLVSQIPIWIPLTETDPEILTYFAPPAFPQISIGFNIPTLYLTRAPFLFNFKYIILHFYTVLQQARIRMALTRPKYTWGCSNMCAAQCGKGAGADQQEIQLKS